jgi:hypothetical protein
MSVRLIEGGRVELSGRCSIEDAEVLLRHLIADPRRGIEWSTCEHLHCAVLQVLLAARPPVSGTPTDAFLSQHIAPLLQSNLNRNP